MLFHYPLQSHVRRHGPVYDTTESYRDWIRDEFTFRCVYCLQREKWGKLTGGYEIEHWKPRSHHPDLELAYDNLFYACSSCNKKKLTNAIPDPGSHFTRESVSVASDVSIRGTTPEAQAIIDALCLDSHEYRKFRYFWLQIYDAVVQSEDEHLLDLLLGFPKDLPNLETKKPNDNTRPDGVQQSWFAKRERGEMLRWIPVD
jgi:hypothetical protein